MTKRLPVIAGILSAMMLSRGLAAVSFDLRTSIGDAVPVMTSVTLDAGDSLVLPAAGDLHYSITVTDRDGEAGVALRLMNEEKQLHRAQVLGYMQTDAHLRVGFVVCGQRVILEYPAPDQSATCAELPPLAPLDPNPTECIECVGAYEGMPASINERARIAPSNARGEALTITGRALRPDGASVSGVVVYAFQTDGAGNYPMPTVPRSTHSQSHGNFRGWALTNAMGQYTFDTIRPGGYPDQGEPQHIHMVVIEPGCGMYFVEDIHFSDDPRLVNLADAQRPNYFTGIFGSGVVSPEMDESGSWHARRDLYIGQGIDGYEACSHE